MSFNISILISGHLADFHHIPGPQGNLEIDSLHFFSISQNQQDRRVWSFHKSPGTMECDAHSLKTKSQKSHIYIYVYIWILFMEHQWHIVAPSGPYSTPNIMRPWSPSQVSNNTVFQAVRLLGCLICFLCRCFDHNAQPYMKSRQGSKQEKFISSLWCS